MATETDEQKIERLTKENATLKAANETLVNEQAVAEKVIADLKEKLEEKESGIVKLPSLEIGKQTYELVGGAFTWKGEEVTIERLKEDSKLAQELVKEGVGSLRKLVA